MIGERRKSITIITISYAITPNAAIVITIQSTAKHRRFTVIVLLKSVVFGKIERGLKFNYMLIGLYGVALTFFYVMEKVTHSSMRSNNRRIHEWTSWRRSH